jgi:hypothetical protein
MTVTEFRHQLAQIDDPDNTELLVKIYDGHCPRAVHVAGLIYNPAKNTFNVEVEVYD